MPQHLHHVIFWTIMAILFFLSFLIIRPYLTALISAFVLAYLIQPFYVFLRKRMNRHLAAFLALALPLLILAIPALLIIGTLAREIIGAVNSQSFTQLLVSLQSSEFFASLPFNIHELQSQIFAWTLPVVREMLLSLPTFVIGFLIIFIGAYYILINWSVLSSTLKSYLPFKEKERVALEIGKATDGIVKGYLLIALLEFVIAFIGFKIAGIEYYIFLSFLIALFAFIPLLGPGLVWIPLTFYYFLNGNMFASITILITGLIISIIVDGFLVAKVVGDKARIHPLVMLVGILGGVPLFGIFGIIIGPLVLLYTLKLIEESIKSAKDN